MPAKVASISCCGKHRLLKVRVASSACNFSSMDRETMGGRIARLRTAKGWSRPELGRQMAAALKRDKPFSGEAVRLYEEDKNDPGREARRALALVFGRSESFIEFGDSPSIPATQARQPEGEYRSVSQRALDVARRFDLLSPECQEHVSSQIDLLAKSVADYESRARAAEHDIVIKGNAMRKRAQRKNRRRN